MIRRSLAASLLMALTLAAGAAPISLKELDLLVRMRVPEGEIIRDLETRRLLAPLDAATEKQLVENGASPALIQRLKTGDFAVPAQTALTLQQQEAQRQAAIVRANQEDAAAFQAQARARAAAVLATRPAADTTRKLLDGKLVRLDNGDLRSYSADELKGVRIYAFYYSAFWCGPCRAFTPELIAYYHRVKAQHPEFEIIFVSEDYNPASMQTYAVKTGMPWPMVRYEQITPEIKQYLGHGIPWLVLVNDAGEPISSNGRTKQYAEPKTILAGLDKIFAQLPGVRR